MAGEALGYLFMFFGSVMFVGVKFFIGRLLKGIIGLIASIVLSIVLTVAAMSVVGFCPALATFFMCGILVLTGFPGVLIIWLAPFFAQKMPFIGGALFPAVQPLLFTTTILFVIAGIEFLLKLFVAFGPFIPIPPVPAIADGLGIAMPFIEPIFGLVMMVIIWSAFSTTCFGIPACFYGGGTTAAIPGTGGVHLGVT